MTGSQLQPALRGFGTKGGLEPVAALPEPQLVADVAVGEQPDDAEVGGRLPAAAVTERRWRGHVRGVAASFDTAATVNTCAAGTAM